MVNNKNNKRPKSKNMTITRKRAFSKVKYKRKYYFINGKKVSICYYIYNRIHLWIRRKYGKANKCAICKIPNASRYEWALKKGLKYSRNINDYIQMCVKCHRNYDITDEFRKKCSIKLKNNPLDNKVPVYKINPLTGHIIQSYNSLLEASVSNNISRTSISNVLSNRSKTAGGFKWTTIN